MPKARLVFNGDNVYIEKDARIYWLKDDIASKIDWIPWVIDSLDSTSPDDALSANMGRVLQDQINAMSWIGNFLSTWDCTTGLPGTNPQVDPYTYNAGDFYIVSNVGATNYKPHGGTFVQWVPSTTAETENVWINDKYFFDWADWVRIPNTATQITIDTALSTSSTNAVENRAIANAINAKQDTISDLSTIRAGAALWSTALQPWDNITELTNNVGYQTAWDVEVAISEHFYVWATAPLNPSEGMLWYDTTEDILKTYNGAAWESSAGWEWKQAFFKTQAEYNALPASKETDGNLYIIVDAHDVPADLLCFTAEEANSTIKLTNSSYYNRFPDYQPQLEVSRDGALWFPFGVEYTDRPWDTIVLENVWDKIYMRNVSETPTEFSLGDGVMHRFIMTGTIAVSWDIWYLLCKNSTNTLSWSFWDIDSNWLFSDCPITTTPSLPATSIWGYAYTWMFSWCTRLTTIPALPATALHRGSYSWMFAWCSSIKLSETQDDEYTQPYRIPMEWTGTDDSDFPKALKDMFSWTGWTFTWTPEINKTYYVHKSIRIV